MSSNPATAVSAPSTAPKKARRGQVRLARFTRITVDRDPLRRFVASETGTVYHGLHRLDFSPKPPTGQTDQVGTAPCVTLVASRSFTKDFARAGDVDQGNLRLWTLQQVARQWVAAGCPEAGEFTPNYDLIVVNGEKSNSTYSAAGE